MNDSEYLALEELDSYLKVKGDEVYTYLKIQCRDADLAADLSQSVLMKFIEQVGKGKIKRQSAGGYLIQMAKNEYLQTFRGKKVVPLDWEVSDNVGKKKIETNSHEIHILLMETLGSPAMPDEVAEVLRYRFLDDLAGNEICEKTGKSRTTVHRLMQKGLTVLLDVFHKNGFDTAELY